MKGENKDGKTFCCMPSMGGKIDGQVPNLPRWDKELDYGCGIACKGDETKINHFIK